MATIGGSLYAEPVHVFFDGLRSYNAEAACAVLADDADLVSPWNEGTLTGKDDIQAVLESLVSNPETRPSFTIQDVRGDGNIVQLDVSMSGRFGRAPQNVRIACLHLHGRIHHVVIEGRGAPIKWAPVKVAKPEPTPVVEEADHTPRGAPRV